MSGRHRLQHFALGGCLAALLLATPALSQGEDQKAAEKPQTQPADQSTIEAPTVPAPVAPTESSGGGHDDERQSGKSEETQQHSPGFGDRFWLWLDANVGGRDGYAQWLMALFGTIATGISIWAVCLLKATLRATRDAVEHGRLGAEAAQTAASAAQNTVFITGTTAERQLRAYLSLTPAGVHSRDDVWSILVAQKNDGQTPAKKVRYSAVIQVLPYPLPDDFEFPKPHFGEGVNVIAPGHEFTVTGQFAPITREILDDLRTSNQRLYFIGVLWYEDVYEWGRETRACWSYSLDDMAGTIDRFRTLWRTSDPQRNTPMDIAFHYASQHNDAT